MATSLSYKLFGHHEPVARMYLAAFDQCAIAAAEFELFRIEPLAPGMVVAVGEHEEQAVDLDLLATTEQR